MNNLELIITQGPYSDFIEELSDMDEVTGIRLNTVMPVKEGRVKEKLEEISELISPKPLWIDLKARQLRIKEFANTPYTVVTISHRIKVDLPNIVYFDNGKITAKLVDIDENKLILADYVGRLLGPGESVNIIDSSLEFIDPELLTPKDMLYVQTAKDVGIKHFMLSFTESAEDIGYLKNLYKDSIITAKIESQKGMKNLEKITEVADYVMAARGDLYTELDYPHEIIKALKYIRKVAQDKSMAGSRTLESLMKHPFPSCSDIMDIGFLKEMGYFRFLIGDDICFKKDILMQAINIFNAIFNGEN